ncbi:MAG: sulfur carrier protein ThiS [Lachnospiraceae bacterium]
MITVNGKELTPEQPVTVAEYLEANQYQVNRIAVELNYEILPKSSYASTVLKDGDILEIVSFVGGG